MTEYKTLIEEKDYCDQSDLLTSQYANQPPIEFQAELEFLQKWLIEDSQSSLIITGDRQSGKKTLLCSFLKANKELHSNWLHIAHFGSITPIYSHILYKIMIELRNRYKIQQKVDLNEQKLRRYFKYWLQVVSQFIKKEYLGYNRSQVPKVVIIIEGVDECVDIKGNIIQPQFWLPSHIPNNIKLILTTKTINEELIKTSTILRHHISKEKKERLIMNFCDKVKSLHYKNTQLSLYILQMVHKMIELKPTFNPITTDFKSIIAQYISCVTNKELNIDQIKSLLYILTLTRKGLKTRWIQKIVSVSNENLDNFIQIFSFFIVQQQEYYIICNKTARSLIQQLNDPFSEKIKAYRQSIARSIRNQAIHLRGMQEIVYQLLLSESYNELKEVISRVQNFLMLYTPLSKDLLCQCWVKLEQLEQYDPVFEYNKAIQAFTSHYYPKEEELYRIIFQMCMFFKQYSEFQNARTPAFRHPLIRGEIDQLQQIGIHQELKNLGMVGKCKIFKMKPLQKMTIAKLKTEMNKKQTKQNSLLIVKRQKQNIKQSQKTQRSYKNNKKLSSKKQEEDPSQNSNSRPPSSEENQLQTPALLVQPNINIEELNVSIISNQQKFRMFFTSEMRQYLQNYYTPLKKSITKQKQLSFQSQQSDNQQQSCKQKGQRQIRFDLQKQKEALILKKYRQYLQQNYHKSGEEVHFYYYKQWVWLQFPWICQTVKHVYSNMIRECLPGSIHYMSPLRQFTLIRQVLKIARNAKDNKIGIFAEKKIEMLPIRYSVAKLQLLKKQPKSPKELDNTVSYTKKNSIQEENNPKYQFNLNKIEEEIIKQKYYQQHYKQKYCQQSKVMRGQSSLPNLNMFLTNVQKDDRVFPALVKSKLLRGNKKNKQNKQDSRDFTQIIRKFNEIKHENDMLIQKIEEMKKMNLSQVDRTKEQQMQISNKIKELEQKKLNLQRSFNAQGELQKKLQVIIKICDLNKMYGSESDYLSTYLESLKQMITIEETKNQQIKDRINNFVEESKNKIKQLKHHKKNMKNVYQNTTHPYGNCGTDSTNRQYVQIPISQIEHDLAEIGKALKTKSKKEKERTRKQFYISSQDYQMLQQQLGFKYGSPNNQALMTKYIDKIEKKRQLILNNADLGKELATKLESLRRVNHIMNQQSKNQKALKVANQLIEKRRQLSSIKRRNQLILHAVDTLSILKSQ